MNKTKIIGTDALMLSAETAVGAYPVEAIHFLVRCAEISECSLDYDAILATGNISYGSENYR